MARLLLATLLLLALAACGAALSTATKIFGHAIKNSVLPPKVETTVFEHNCSVPPCTITLIHVPSIYPGQGEGWDWQNGILRVFIDNEESASIEVTLLQLAAVGRQGSVGVAPTHDGSPFGIGLMGKTARSGGVYSQARIPFGTHVRLTMQSPYKNTAVLWLIVRGYESYPVQLGDLTLPDTARLQVVTRSDVVLKPLDFVSLMNFSSTYSGALLRFQFESTSADYSYLEACLRFYHDGDNVNPLFLSSGAEDYFLSASYFDEGMFKTPNSGLTYFDGKGNLSVYKTHDHDPIVFHNGGALLWRNCETTTGCGTTQNCPQKFCLADEREREARQALSAEELEEHQVQERLARSILASHKRTGASAPSDNVATYSVQIWVYTWPAADTPAPAPRETKEAALASCLSLLRTLEASGLLSADHVDALVAHVQRDRSVLALCASMPSADSWAARQLRNTLLKQHHTE